MDQHVTYHPITDELLQSYRYYISGEDGARVAGEHCAATGMDDAQTSRFLDLLPHFAAPAAYPFDQTHGFSIALTQGFFGPYFYINDARLSDLGDQVAAYAQPWQQTLADWDVSGTAQNTVLSKFSSGVFIPADKVAVFMSDAHAVPELSQALGTHFSGEKLGVLWTALQYAHDTGSGLLEAAGALEPNTAHVGASVCFTRLDQCDAASLQMFVASQQPAPAASPPPPAAALPVPPHLADRAPAATGSRLPTTPSLTERLRAKRETAPQFAPETQPSLVASAAQAPDTQLPVPPAPAPQPPDTQLPVPPAPSRPDTNAELPSPVAAAPASEPAETDPAPRPPAPSTPEPDSELTALPTPAPDSGDELPPPPAAPSTPEPDSELTALPTPAPDSGDEPAPPEAPSAPPAPTADTTAHAQPTQALDVTLGRASLDDTTIDFVSGAAGPAADEHDSTGPRLNRLHWRTHVEGHAAALMRQRGLDELVLMTNHPDGVCRACDFQAPDMMSPGSTLVVHTPGPNDTTRTQWIDQHGVHDHDPAHGPADGPSEDDRIRLRPGGCWGQGSLYFDTWDSAWEHIESLIGSNPFFFDVSHMGDAWEPFSLVGAQQGTAVIEFVRSAAPFAMRLHGLGVNPLPELLPIQVQWTADEPAPVALGIDAVHLLPANLAREAADLLIATEDRTSLAFNEVPVFADRVPG